MANFYSYPHNYIQSFTGDAGKVSNPNSRDPVSGESITFDFDMSETGPFQNRIDIDTIYLVSENIRTINMNSTFRGFFKSPKFLVQRGGLLFTIDTHDSFICALDSTGQYVSRIAPITDSLTSLDGLVSYQDGLWISSNTNNTKLHKLNPITGKISQEREISQNGPTVFCQDKLYIASGSNLYIDGVDSPINLSIPIIDLTCINQNLYAITRDKLYKINPTAETKSELLNLVIDPQGITNIGNNLYLIGNDNLMYRINANRIESPKKISQGKQYLFSNLNEPISVTENSNRLTITSPDQNARIHKLLLLKKEETLGYSSPTPGVSDPWIKEGEEGEEDEIIFPSDFSEIGITQTEQGVVSHQNVHGSRIKRQPYVSRSKYETSYTMPIRNLKQVQALQNFRNTHLNFTFAPNPILYPDRVYPAHFSRFELPINYISKSLAQDNRYSLEFTVTEN